MADLTKLMEQVIARHPRVFRPVAHRLVPRLSDTAVASHPFAGFTLACLGSAIGQRVVGKARLRTNRAIHVYRGTAGGEEIVRHGIYEPETADLVARILQPGMCFLDIGANIGQYTVLAADLVGPEGMVIAFEADPSIVATLQRNVTMNDLPQVLICGVALAEDAGETPFHVASPRYAGGGSLVRSRYASGETIMVETRRLDDLLLDKNVARVDLIKIDVEGAELAVLRGGTRGLHRYDFPHLIVEFSDINLANFGASGDDLAEYLLSLGYSLFEIGVRGILPLDIGKPRQETYFNVFATKEERMSEVMELLS